jgi:hypothetical protein
VYISLASPSSSFSTATPSPSSDSGGSSLTLADKIGLGLSLGLGVPPCIVAVWKIWEKLTKRESDKQHDTPLRTLAPHVTSS